MSFFAILFALLIEQVRPLARNNPVHHGVRGWLQWVGRNFDAGRSHHGWLAWSLAVCVPALATLGVYALLSTLLGWPVAILWSTAILYVTLGFRQFSHHFTAIRDALDAGDEARARQLLARWQRVDASELPRSEIVRHVIEHSVLAAHRHVFGVLCWFSVLAALGLGPAGAVFYRVAELVARRGRRGGAVAHESVALQQASAKAWAWIDWLPARVTALGFAVVGSFEEAIDSWRVHVQQPDADNDGVILAATGGAINVRLGGAALRPAGSAGGEGGSEPPPGESLAGVQGREPDPAHLTQVVGLVWRSVVLWLLLLALLTLARLLG